MISHVLDAAIKADLFDVVHVSTEDPEIADVASGSGAPVAFMRPQSLADDHTPIMPVLRHVVEEFANRGREFDQVWMLMACSPLLESADLKEAATLYEQAGGGRPVLAVSHFPAPIEWAFERDLNGNLTPLQPGMFSVRSQDLSPRYFDAGVFSAFPASHVRQSAGAGDDSGFLGYVLPRHKSVDIDTEADWKFAELLFDAIKRSGSD